MVDVLVGGLYGGGELSLGIVVEGEEIGLGKIGTSCS